MSHNPESGVCMCRGIGPRCAVCEARSGAWKRAQARRASDGSTQKAKSEHPNEPGRIAIQDGSEIIVDVLRWDEGWDFDCPVCVIRPVVRFSPNGEHADELVEELALDASIYGHLPIEQEQSGLVDRQYPIKTLKRRWSQARRGVEFPVKGYTASRFTVRFHADDDGLAFTIEEE